MTTLESLNTLAREISAARVDMDQRLGVALSKVRKAIKSERARLGLQGKP